MRLSNKIVYFVLFFFHILKSVILGIFAKSNVLFLFTKLKNFYLHLAFFKNNTIASFNSLLDIVAVDYVLCNNFRFELTYIFWNIFFELRAGIKILISGLVPIYSISSLFSSSSWLEREIWDMFGVKFIFHKGLRRILTDYGFKGYPLRKDFPLVGFFDVAFDDFTKAVKLMPIELAQNLRFYKCSNPWGSF